MAENADTFSGLFNIAAVSLAIDMLLVFPVSHGSIIGKAITEISSGFVIPPLDWLATNVLSLSPSGFTGIAQAAANPAASGCIFTGAGLSCGP